MNKRCKKREMNNTDLWKLAEEEFPRQRLFESYPLCRYDGYQEAR